MRRPWPRSLRVVAVVALLAAACGNRVDPDTTSGAAGSYGAVGGAVASPGPAGAAGTGPSATGAAGIGVEAGPTGAAAPVASGGGAEHAGAEGAGGEQASTAAAAGDNGGATDTGVTADSILVGGLAVLSGLGAENITPYRMGYDAGVAFVNAAGGVNGRKLKVTWKDTQLNASRYAALARELIESDKVFALTSADLSSGGGGQYIASKGVPVVGGESATAEWFSNPMYFPLGNQYNGTATMAYWAASKKRLTKAAVMSINVAVSQEGCRSTSAQLRKMGVPVVYEASVPAAQTDLSSYVQQARSAGADGILQCFDIATAVGLMQTLQRQRWKPYVGAVSGSASVDLLRGAPGDMIEGMDVNFPLPSWTDTRVPAIADYLNATQAIAGKQARHNNFSVRGFAAVLLLRDALRAVGPNVTRKAVVAWLNRQTNYSLGGLLPPDTTFVPDAKGHHVESRCSQEWTVRASSFAAASDGWVCLP